MIGSSFKPAITLSSCLVTSTQAAFRCLCSSIGLAFVAFGLILLSNENQVDQLRQGAQQRLTSSARDQLQLCNRHLQQLRNQAIPDKEL